MDRGIGEGTVRRGDYRNTKRTHGQNQGGGWKWGREGGQPGWGGGMGRKGTQL